MIKNKLLIALCLLCSVAFAGCNSSTDDEEPDGKWPAIQLTVNGNEYKSSIYEVPAEGGEYRIYSKNYGELWLNSVSEESNVVWPESYDQRDYKNIHLIKDWYEVQYDESGNIVVKISAKEESAEPRSVSLDLEFGDAFGYIKLSQK